MRMLILSSARYRPCRIARDRADFRKNLSANRFVIYSMIPTFEMIDPLDVIAGHSPSKTGVNALLFPAIPIDVAPLCVPKRVRRDKPGDDESGFVEAGITWQCRTDETGH